MVDAAFDILSGFKQKDGSYLVLDRYRVQPCLESYLGHGSFSIVFAGYDEVAFCRVAVKTFHGTVDDEMQAQRRSKFLGEVQIFQTLFGRVEVNFGEAARRSIDFELTVKEQAAAADATQRICENLPTDVKPADCFVELLDYSRDEFNKPGGSPVDGNYYIILEKAEFTLQDCVEERSSCDEGFCLEEIQNFCCCLLRILVALHSKQFVHLDIKPANIMYFAANDAWKFIDLDSILNTQKEIDVFDGNTTFTPLYCPPEIAAIIAGEADSIKTSRLMDIWSIGLTILDLIFLKPYLEGIFLQMRTNTGDDHQFYSWLGSNHKLSLPESLTEISPEFFDFVSQMIEKDPEKRCTAFCHLEHPFIASDWSTHDRTPRENMVTKAERHSLSIHSQSRKESIVQRNSSISLTEMSEKDLLRDLSTLSAKIKEVPLNQIMGYNHTQSNGSLEISGSQGDVSEYTDFLTQSKHKVKNLSKQTSKDFDEPIRCNFSSASIMNRGFINNDYGKKTFSQRNMKIFQQLTSNAHPSMKGIVEEEVIKNRSISQIKEITASERHHSYRLPYGALKAVIKNKIANIARLSAEMGVVPKKSEIIPTNGENKILLDNPEKIKASKACVIQ